MPSNPPNLQVLINALAAEEVSFVLIRGFAVVLHGGRTTTMDSDFAVAADAGNVASIVRALAPLNAKPWHWNHGTPFVWDELSIRGSNVSLQTSVGDVDLRFELPAVDSFQGLLARSTSMRLGQVSFNVAAVDDLIAMKRAAGRPQDLAHIAELERIKKASE